jgi:hypothetical protein
MRSVKAMGRALGQQRRWTYAVLCLGALGFVTAIGLKVGHASVDPKSLLFLSLGLICLALGLGARLEIHAMRLRVPPVDPAGRGLPNAVARARSPIALLLYAGIGLIALSWMLLHV